MEIRGSNPLGPTSKVNGICYLKQKRKRISAGSGEKMRKPGTKGAPTAKNFKQAAKTAKPAKKRR